jgi:hypothetical protein
MYSGILSSAQRLPNGNTLICTGAWGTITEVTPAGEEVWRYVNPVVSDTVIVPQFSQVPDEGINRDANTIFRAHRFGPDHPALAGRDLTPGLTIEDGALSTSIETETPAKSRHVRIDAPFPNPFRERTTFTFSTGGARHVELVVVDVLGRVVRRVVDDVLPAGSHEASWTGTDEAGRTVAAGVYIAFLEYDGSRIARTVTRVR